MAIVQTYLHFRPAWEQEMLAERNDLLVLYESFCIDQQHLLLALMGLNHLYYPGFKWVDQTMGQLSIAPPRLASRFHSVNCLRVDLHTPDRRETPVYT